MIVPNIPHFYVKPVKKYLLLPTNAAITANATLARIDDEHANADTAWVKLGRPALDPYAPDPKVLAALHAATELTEEPLEVAAVGSSSSSSSSSSRATVRVVVGVQRHGVYRARVWLQRPNEH